MKKIEPKVVIAPWPSFTQEEADKASSVLLSNKVNYWTGTEGREFEKEFAAYVGTEYAIALANGTLAPCEYRRPRSHTAQVRAESR